MTEKFIFRFDTIGGVPEPPAPTAEEKPLDFEALRAGAELVGGLYVSYCDLPSEQGEAVNRIVKDARRLIAMAERCWKSERDCKNWEANYNDMADRYESMKAGLNRSFNDVMDAKDAIAKERDGLKEQVAKLESQLPKGMKHCTIVFKECKKGHGWLTATNWIQHECPTCERDQLKAKLAEYESQPSGLCEVDVLHINETGTVNDGRWDDVYWVPLTAILNTLPKE